MHLAELQDLMERTYGTRDRDRGLPAAVAWLAEEVGELAQALRKGTEDQQRDEFADVLAWVATLANIVEIDLDRALARYATGCPKCGGVPCACRPVAWWTAGSEVAAGWENRRMEPDEAATTTGSMRRRSVLGSADELLAGATGRTVLAAGDSKSGAAIERVEIGGEAFIAKRLCVEEDWSMRASGDLCGRTLLLWQHGILDRLPADIDHTVVAMAHDPTTRVTTFLMRDVGPYLVPEGDARIALADHRGFLGSMASIQARFQGWEDDVGLATMVDRYLELSPLMAECERERGDPALVPRLVGEGWQRLPGLVPSCGGAVRDLARDPSPLVEALSGCGPSTLVHGNWKLGNLGRHPDGRTILLDWETPGAGAGAIDLAWYLAVNAARLPESKEAAIGTYGRALAERGVAGGGWFDRQVALALLGGFVQFGWEKALGGAGPELAWWEARALEALPLLN